MERAGTTVPLPGAEPPVASYTSSQSRGAFALARDAVYLYRSYTQPERWVAEALDKVRLQEGEIADSLGTEVAGLRMLDVGAGQRLVGMTYFGKRNDVVGIDLDVVVQGLDPAGYLKMLRTNGARRVLKTLARKALLIDLRGRRELERQLGIEAVPRMDVRQMDASSLAFPDASFDAVYSLEVFSFVSDAAAALAETARVLRPGGVANHNFLLYTARRGALDIRTIGYRAADIPLWAHLRPQHRHLVLESAYLNRLRLTDWQALVDRHVPGARLRLWQDEREWLEPEARRLHESGELLDYELDELVTTDVSITWQKPACTA